MNVAAAVTRPLPWWDPQRASFVNGLKRKYRADYAFYSGSGPIQYDGRTVEALALPRSVLEKFYHENARRIILNPGGRQGLFFS